MKYLALVSLVLVTSCEWTSRQANSMMDWANETMPTYDGSRPGLEPKAGEQAAPPMPGYMGSTSTPVDQMRAPSTAVPASQPNAAEQMRTPTQGAATIPQPNAAVPAPHNFNAATTPTAMPSEPDYFDPSIPQTK